MKPKNINIKTSSPKEFRVDYDYGEVYEFPFHALDPNPRRSGRIEWHIECFTEYNRKEKRHYICKLWVWATSTFDPRYRGKIFEIPCYTEAIHGNPMGHGKKIMESSFLQSVWKFMPFSDNGNFVLSAYPNNEHTVLRIACNSSIFIEPKFLVRSEHQ